MSISYGQLLTPEEEAAEKLELEIYWAERKEQDKRLKREESAKKKKARTRRANRTYYVKTLKEAAEASRLEWHAVRARNREKKARDKELAEASVLCKALGLKTDEEIKAFIAIREVLPTQVVHALAQGGFIDAKNVEPALHYLAGTK